MKKKIKDLTLAEVEKYCDTHFCRDCQLKICKCGLDLTEGRGRSLCEDNTEIEVDEE